MNMKKLFILHERPGSRQYPIPNDVFFIRDGSAIRITELSPVPNDRDERFATIVLHKQPDADKERVFNVGRLEFKTLVAALEIDENEQLKAAGFRTEVVVPGHYHAD